MAEPYSFTTSQDPISGDYQQILHWTVKDKPSRTILLQVLAIPVFIFWGFAFSVPAIRIGKLPETIQFGIPEIGLFLAGIVATIIAHEGIHGLAMRGCGVRPKFGVIWKKLMFYATAPGFGFRRNSYIGVALAPLVGLSCSAILGMVLLQGTNWVALLTVCAGMNGSGAIGDLCFVSIVLRYPKNAYIVDKCDGIRIFVR
jgi:hypothetical protein